MGADFDHNFTDRQAARRNFQKRRVGGVSAHDWSVCFFYVCLHLSAYVGLNLQLDIDEFIKDITKRIFITIGIITFTLLLPLAITSTKGMIKRIGGKRWQKLHMLIYPISLLGVFHFYMMVRADFTRPSIYLAIILVLLGYRIWAKRKKSRPKKVAAA